MFHFSGSQHQHEPTNGIPKTSFTCRQRETGYYADVETDCQVYHMCDEQGRQFSYTCPNATLFQQRMLICDHWYMVDCSSSEANYEFNRLIGQRVIEADYRFGRSQQFFNFYNFIGSTVCVSKRCREENAKTRPIGPSVRSRL